jgi:mRNA-degrading endonuclease RelE of RelBE toxin-antitoxin system
MIYKTVATPDFERELKRLSRKHASLAKDFAGFLDSIEREPQQGTPLGNNCYKIRLAITAKEEARAVEQGLLPM